MSHFVQQSLFWKIFHQLHFSLQVLQRSQQESQDCEGQHGVAIGQAGDTIGQQGVATGHGHGVATAHGAGQGF